MASKLIGAIVGTFKVAPSPTGTKVGPPIFQPDRPKILLKGGPFTVRALGDLKSIPVGCGRMILAAKHADVSHQYILAVGVPHLILKGKGFRPVEPDKQRPGCARITLKGKPFLLNKSAIVQIHKPKLILKGISPTKLGKAGLIPTVPQTKILVPTAVADEGNLVPSPAYTGLLVPTTVRVI